MLKQIINLVTVYFVNELVLRRKINTEMDKWSVEKHTRVDGYGGYLSDHH